MHKISAAMKGSLTELVTTSYTQIETPIFLSIRNQKNDSGTIDPNHSLLLKGSSGAGSGYMECKWKQVMYIRHIDLRSVWLGSEKLHSLKYHIS